MAAKIKLQRKGAKNRPFYRVVVQDESAARDSKVIEVLGQYDPLKEPSLFEVDKDKTKAWLAKGAEPTEKVRILLGKAGILPPVDLAALTKRKPKAEEKAEAAAAGKPAEAAPPAEGKPAEAAPPAEGKPAEEKKEEAKAKEEPVKKEG
ncbi:30S ribosomal protein S16 [Candidatus Margulisiibacteriota bacterium]